MLHGNEVKAWEWFMMLVTESGIRCSHCQRNVDIYIDYGYLYHAESWTERYWKNHTAVVYRGCHCWQKYYRFMDEINSEFSGVMTTDSWEEIPF